MVTPKKSPTPVAMWVAMRSRKDDGDAVGEFEQGIFERAQGIHVEVVGGIVE